jgi:hypothetical protein
LRWRAQVYETDFPYTVYSFDSNAPAGTADRAHDLALTPNGEKVIVTSTQQDSIITGVNSGAPSLVTPAFPVDGDPRGDLSVAFVSDSVVASDQHAVVARLGTGALGVKKVFVYFYYLTTSPITQASESDGLFDVQYPIYPCDLMLAPNGNAVLKLVRYGPFGAGNQGEDVVVFDFDQEPTIIAHYETSGRNKWCVDALELGANRILTASSEDSGSPVVVNDSETAGA